MQMHARTRALLQPVYLLDSFLVLALGSRFLSFDRKVTVG
jgi:hypothetical protein